MDKQQVVEQMKEYGWAMLNTYAAFMASQADEVEKTSLALSLSGVPGLVAEALANLQDVAAMLAEPVEVLV
jgi:hypothetical protein